MTAVPGSWSYNIPDSTLARRSQATGMAGIWHTEHHPHSLSVMNWCRGVEGRSQYTVAWWQFYWDENFTLTKCWALVSCWAVQPKDCPSLCYCGPENVFYTIHIFLNKKACTFLKCIRLSPTCGYVEIYKRLFYVCAYVAVHFKWNGCKLDTGEP